MIHLVKHDNNDKGQNSYSDQSKNIELDSVTTGTSGEVRVFSFWDESNPVREAKMVIPQITNRTVADQVKRLLFTIHLMIEIAKSKRPNLGNIPPLIAHTSEGDAVLIEWIFPDFRVGFNIELNPNESGWHLVSNKKLDEVTASGQLGDMDTIIHTLLGFILSNI